MPFTPFHLGPALLLGLIFFSYVDFPTFLIANMIIDIEPFVVLTMNLGYPLHGILHSFMGGTLTGFLLAMMMKKVRGFLTPVLRFFKLEQKVSLEHILLASFSGIYLHIILDSPLYSEMRPFFPLDINPLLSTNATATFGIYTLCTILFIAGIALYMAKPIHEQRKRQNPSLTH